MTQTLLERLKIVVNDYDVPMCLVGEAMRDEIKEIIKFHEKNTEVTDGISKENES